MAIGARSCACASIYVTACLRGVYTYSEVARIVVHILWWW